MTRTHLLTALLLDALEAEGRKFGTGQLLRLQELLRQLPEDASDEALCLALVPLLARNPQEQAGIYEKWEVCCRQADQLLAAATVAPSPEKVVEAERALRRWRWRVWLPVVLLTLLVLGTLLCLLLLRSEQKPVVLNQEIIVNTGQSAHLCPTGFPTSDSLPGRVNRLSIAFSKAFAPKDLNRGGVPNKGEGSPQDNDPGKSGTSAFGTFFIQNDTCLLYAAGDSTGRDSLVLALNFADGKKAELRLRIYVSKPAEVVQSAPETPQITPVFSPKPLPFPHDIRALAVQSPADWVVWLARWWPWLRWAALGLLLASLFALVKYWIWKRRKLIAELRSRDKPPYVWNIRIPGSDEIVLGDDFAQVLQVLRRRASADHWRLDLSATIAATAAKGGMPDFRFRQQTRPVDYLLLLDRQSHYNHRAQLYDALYRAFRAQEIEIARFFFDSDIRLCYNEDHPNGLYLSDIAQRYPDARLIVVGTGAQIISPHTGRAEPWAGIFQTWRESLLLTPKPHSEWNRNEQRLAEHFQALLPASLQSLRFWAEEMEAGEDARFGEWRERVQDSPAAFWQPDPEVPLPLLQLQYDERMLRWIALCAIYPTLHYDLTLWLGTLDLATFEKLSNLEMPNNPVASNAITLSDLTELFRLRWFVDGQIPQAARAALLDWLQAEDPELLARTRLALADLLRQSPPPDDSAAFNDHALSVALNEWLATQDPQRRKELEKQIAQLLDAGAEADFVALKYLEKPRSPLDFMVPEAWKKYVHPGKMPALGNRFALIGGLALGALALGGLGDWALSRWLHQQMNPCKGETVEYVLRPSPRFDNFSKVVKSVKSVKSEDARLTLCLDSPEDSLLWQERLLLDAIEDRNAARFDSLVKEMDPPKVSDTLMEQMALNILTSFFNNGVHYATKNQLDSACYWVQLGNLDLGQGMEPIKPKPLIYDIKLARNFWCDPLQDADTTTAQTDFRLQQIPEAGKPVSFTLLNPKPSRKYTLQPEAGASRLVFKNGVLKYTYKTSGPVVARLFEDGQLLRSRAVVVALQAKLSSPRAVIEEGNPDTNGIFTKALLTALISPPMVFVPGGTFRMGSPEDGPDAESDEKPAHDVTLSDFEIGKYEVTIEEYLAFCDETKTHYPEWLEPGSEYNVETGSNDYYKKGGMSRANKKHPVTGVSWLDATAYCAWLSQKTGQKYRLPTEAEWEYAARGGQAGLKDNFRYAGSNTLGEVGWYSDNSEGKTHPVGQKNNNQLGIYDLSGNVYEWCSDWYGDYGSSAQTNPAGPVSGSSRVIRGGSWYDVPQFCRVADRFLNSPGIRNVYFGLRLSRTR